MTRITPVEHYRLRTTRLALFLTLVHTVPVIWLTPVAGGTAPIAALVAVGVAGLFAFDGEALAMGLMALGPALIYLPLAWAVAWLTARLTLRLAPRVRLPVLGLLVVVPLAAVYFPIYVAGGHGGSTSASLVTLVTGYGRGALFLFYWVALQAVIAALLLVQITGLVTSQLPQLDRWTGRTLRAVLVLVVGTLVLTNVTATVCRPLAYLGLDRAQLCVARAGGVDARYWYERAALDGNAAALAWIVDNTPDRQRRLEWLRVGAEAGVPAMAYELYRFLNRYGGPGDAAEAEVRLQSAAAAGYGPAQMVLVERLTVEIRQSGSIESLDRRRELLESAAANGSALAWQRLAEHYERGSMGYPVDLDQARFYYDRLLAQGGPADELGFEVTNGQVTGAGVYRARLEEIDRWQAGLAAGDTATLTMLGRLYLGSELPGDGVREQGLALLEQAAATDPEARRTLILMLRTGTDGADRDPQRAREWLLRAARAGEVDAMERVVNNYLDGREGFPQDIPEARRWIDALKNHYQRLGGAEAQRHLVALERETRYVERLAEMAGGELLGPEALEALGNRTDAESRFRHGLQLLAVGGPDRRQAAIAQLEAAADLGHAEAAWRLVWIYEHGMPVELDPAAARRALMLAASLHHFEATRALAARYEYGNGGFEQDLPRAIAMYEAALAAGRDNRYGWNLSPEVFTHFAWLESRLKQARLKAAELASAP